MRRVVKNILRIAGWLLLIFVLVAGLAFSSNETAGITCSEIIVRYTGNSPVRLNRKDLVRMVQSADHLIKGKKLVDIDTEKIESVVAKNKAVLKADAYKVTVRDSTGLRGALVLKVKHRTPAIRIISPSGSYFIDREGTRIPTSVEYSADVPVVTGNVGKEMARQELLPFVGFIQSERYWRTQVKQIHVTGEGELVLSTLVGNHLIEFGTTRNMEQKFRNLRAFYEQVLAEGNWNKYSRIILKFDNQVIAKKRK
jgi:cell division protein FtsQ